MTRALDPETFGPWAVVTGASSGIGREFARQLAANGLHVVLVARRLSLLEDLGSELTSTYGVRYRAVGVDLADTDFLSRLDAATHDLDVGLVVSNAGAFLPGALLQLDRDELRRMLNVNVIAHVNLSHHFGRRLASRGRGGMLLISSTAGLQGIPFSAEYAAAKGFVLNLGEALHVELQKSGVHVTVLLPGAVDTPMLSQFGFDLIDTPLKPMSPERCVTEGLDALRKNRATHVAGGINRVIAALVPRRMATSMYGRMAANVLSKRAANEAVAPASRTS